MLRSSVLAASLLFSPPLTQAQLSPTVVIQPDSIVQVMCFGKDYISSGTAFRVGPTGELLSVAHVTSEPDCHIAGKPIGHVWTSKASDFSMIDGDEGPYLSVDCGGFVKGRKYLAIGFARGVSPATVIELTATGQYDRNGEAILEGMISVIPGMSGGALISEDTGRVVGAINAENFEDGLSWSVPLSSTPVCRKAVA